MYGHSHTGLGALVLTLTALLHRLGASGLSHARESLHNLLAHLEAIFPGWAPHGTLWEKSSLGAAIEALRSALHHLHPGNVREVLQHLIERLRG